MITAHEKRIRKELKTIAPAYYKERMQSQRLENKLASKQRVDGTSREAYVKLMGYIPETPDQEQADIPESAAPQGSFRFARVPTDNLGNLMQTLKKYKHDLICEHCTTDGYLTGYAAPRGE